LWCKLCLSGILAIGDLLLGGGFRGLGGILGYQSAGRYLGGY